MTRKKLLPLHEGDLPALHAGEKPFYAGERGARENVSDDVKEDSPEAQEHYVQFTRDEAARLSAKLGIPQSAKPPEEGPETYLG